MATKTKVETQTLKLKVPIDKLEEIDASRIAARYPTRTSYMIDSAVWGSAVYLSDIARHVGQLGRICNAVLIPDVDNPKQRCLESKDAKRAVRKIIEACDAVTAALRR